MAESNWKPFSSHEATVPANSTLIVDSELLTHFENIEYTFKIKKNLDSRSLKLSVHKSDVNVKDQVYAKTGDPINIEMNTLSDGSEYSLEIVNNESVSVGLVFLKMLI